MNGQRECADSVSLRSHWCPIGGNEGVAES